VSLVAPDDPRHDDDEDRRGTAPDMDTWRRQGFTTKQAEVFRRWRFTLNQAMAWRRAGVHDGLRAAQWATAGATPETVPEFLAVGIDASQAVHWHEMGFELRSAKDAARRGLTPATAFAQRTQAARIHASRHGMRSGSATPPARRGEVIRRLLGAGVPPDMLHSYLERGWDGEDIVPWAKAGIEATDSLLWRELGLKPVEASRLEHKGISPADTVRDWWGAGIPFREVADWIGAGLTPPEAAELRARGITASQAAALRELREKDEDP
jgi:hypothetical protein